MSKSKYLAGLLYTILSVFILQLIIKTFFIEYYADFIINFGLNIKEFSVWQFVTYPFLHANFIHLIGNLIILYFVGDLFLRYFTEKQLLRYFFIGGVIGGLCFYFGYDLITKKSNQSPLLIGASASINTLLVALTTKKPKLDIYLRFLGKLKLYVFTLMVFILNLIAVQGTNVGGVLAHIGGALTGFVLVFFFKNVKTKPIFKKKSTLKIIYKEEAFGQSNFQKQRIKQNKIDDLLEKISKSGFESLSADEKSFLKESST